MSSIPAALHLIEESSKCYLLIIPVEVRLMIYEYYLGDDGYTFDFESRRLRDSSDRPVDVSLMFTCSTIAGEMDGLPFKLNTLSFTTGYSESTTTTAYLYNELLHEIHSLEFYVLTRAWACVKKEAIDSISAQFPESQDILNTLREVKSGANFIKVLLPAYHDLRCSQTKQEYTLLIRALLDAISINPNFNSVISDLSKYYKQGVCWENEVMPDPLYPWHGEYQEFRNLLRVPWSIPSNETIVQMANEIKLSDRCLNVTSNFKKNRFSAAAVTIEFLGALKPRIRKHIRKIIVHEDHMSHCNPACHVEGFIHFCIENPKLRIERRLSIWRNVMLGSHRSEDGFYPSVVPANIVPMSLTPWLVDAARLKSRGMPDDSFSLVLDCDGAPEHSASLIRDTIHRYVAWQATYDKAHENFYSKDEATTSAYYPAMFCRELPKVWKDAIEHPENSIIRFNFDLGTMEQPAVRPLNFIQPSSSGEALVDATEWMSEIDYDNELIKPPPQMGSWYELSEYENTLSMRCLENRPFQALESRWWLDEPAA
ncbi:hypothetical protein BU24DRAFT_405110 [Aaosphaeria arxii CBS 175.79]|uniref:Uncharacterized protein n=1 Tax=Aaosphaeria arxii CBS 175.79 TaxID=1450172 RepID=A0A6A5YC56_9PLEO|nr:uncharacterized protein BU24DRAFT_405110 [Aaosphaeria arxii CBS 175.79]KAF2022224.1 hypothetical protein BU24DRAFT_405110 [Aaosphaeria arxii CBS 175.79]